MNSNDGRRVPVVQAYAFGKYLGYLKVTFDSAGNVKDATGNPILMDNSIPQGRLRQRLPEYTWPMLHFTAAVFTDEHLMEFIEPDLLFIMSACVLSGGSSCVCPILIVLI